MKSPIKMSGAALSYWKKYSKPLEDAGILTEYDTHSFALLCRIWGMLDGLDTTPGPESYRSMVQFTNLTKQYLALAKQFGLTPRDRKSGKLGEKKTDLHAMLTEALGGDDAE